MKLFALSFMLVSASAAFANGINSNSAQNAPSQQQQTITIDQAATNAGVDLNPPHIDTNTNVLQPHRQTLRHEFSMGPMSSKHIDSNGFLYAGLTAISDNCEIRQPGGPNLHAHTFYKIKLDSHGLNLVNEKRTYKPGTSSCWVIVDLTKD